MNYSALVSDSRLACKNCLFFCKGNRFKKEYLQTAIDKGASAYVSEIDYNLSVPCILVPDIRRAMAEYSKDYFDDPSGSLNLIGITGTKGKSTTLYFLKSIMESSALCGPDKFGYTSSIDNYDGFSIEESHLTTPEAIELNGLLSNMVKAGIRYAGMEVSSQALKYDRSYGLRFKVGGFTNFSEDHISPDEHSDIEDYFASKLRLINQCDTFIINMDSDRSEAVLRACKAAFDSGSLKKIVTFSSDGKKCADYTFSDVTKENNCIYFELSGFGRLGISMPGLFNAENAVMAALYANELGANREEIAKGLMDARVKGRMEVYKHTTESLTAIVDFAHNGLAFERIFSSVRKEYPDWRIVAVFGCPGNKAYERRIDLPKIAARYADYCYITEDDPFNENVSDICSEVYNNLLSFGGSGEIIEDRETAIRTAVSKAPEKTVIMLLAKGRDTFMHRKSFDPYISDSSLAEELMK